MTDDKKSPLDDFDWDAALSEWDKAPFEPDLAKAKKEADAAAAAAKEEEAGAGAPPPTGRALYRAPLPTIDPAAAQLRSAPKPPPAIPRKRGGLGQLFARGDAPLVPRARETQDEDALDVVFDEPAPRKTVASDEDDDAVLTSAIDVGSEGAAPGDSRSELNADQEADVPEGAMFDPFAERPLRAEQPTRHPPPMADEEEASTSIADIAAMAAKIDAERAKAAPPEPEPEPEPELAPYEQERDDDHASMVSESELIAVPSMVDEDEALAALLDEGAPEAAPRKAYAATPAEAPSPTAELRGVIVFEDERPAAQWVDDAQRDVWEARAQLLEDEAQNALDKTASAHCLLAASEVRAILGDLDGATRLADQALALVPQSPMAHRQRRGLAPFEASELVPLLDAEMQKAPTPAAKLHATLLAADALARASDDEAAAKRLEQAARLAPGDARVVALRAAHALAKGEHNHASLRIPEGDSLAAFASAVASLLALRGVERKGAQPSPSDTLRRARMAIERNDPVAAATLIAELASSPPLSLGARWLAASLAATRTSSRPQAVVLLQSLADGTPGDPASEPDFRALRALAARAIELGDFEALAKAATGDGFDGEERVTLALLAGQLDAIADSDELAPALRVALAATRPVADDAARRARVDRVTGRIASQTATRIGRSFAFPSGAVTEEQLDALQLDDARLARAVRIDEAARGGRFDEVASALDLWSEDANGALAAALVAERAGLPERATTAFEKAVSLDPTNETALRASAALDKTVDLAAGLLRLAEDSVDPARGALLRLEVLLREGKLDERGAELEEIQRLAPQLPFGAFLGERAARKRGDAEAALRFVRERRESSGDPLERALDAVREALFVAGDNPTLAAERLEEALRARPEDVALRELFERLAPEPPADRAAWREERANAATGPARNLLALEAAYEFDRSGDGAGAMRVLRKVIEGGDIPPLLRVALERAELAAGDAGRLADELMSTARSAPDVAARTEAYERLAELDLTARSDPGSALLWHRTILEETPFHPPSLRHVEHVLVTERRDDEVEAVLGAIARFLKGSGGESLAHAEVAARFRMNAGDWDSTKDLADLAADEKEPSLWALRLRDAHARAKGDDEALLASTKALVDRASRPVELATLLTRAGEAALRLGRIDEAAALLQRASSEDPGDPMLWKILAEVQKRAGAHTLAAEALESLARTSSVDEHRVDASYEAAILWIEGAKDETRGVAALEQVAASSITYKDVFPRLSKLYAQRGARPELASLLERRISTVLDPDERVELEVERGRVLAEVGDPGGAKDAFEAALAIQPDHIGALTASGELSAAQKDWEGAEQAWVRLGRLLATPEAQLEVYRQLGELYSVHLGNFSRAEVALQEVLKRAPEDEGAREQLVDVYRRQNDAARAMEMQQDLVGRAKDPKAKQKRVIELAGLYETVGHDLRKAEQTLEAARREFPSDVVMLRTLAEFYIRHKQTPAVNILLDRAAGDARRAFASGRFAPALFETMAMIYELRGKHDAAHVVGATLAAVRGEPSHLRGAAERALDPRLDELLAPEIMAPAARALLARTGSALDTAVPMDPKQLRASPLAASEPLARLALGLAQSAGIGNLQVYVSPQLGRACVPGGSSPPLLVVGEGLVQETNQLAQAYLVTRALKLIQAHGAAFARIPPADLPVLVAAWLKAFNPHWVPQGIAAGPIAEAGRRLQGGLPKQIEPELGMMALEVIGALGPSIGSLGGAILAWANRTALFGVGDPSAALEAIAWSSGPKITGAPKEAEERAAWISRIPEAKDVLAFSVSDAYGEARTRVGLK